jgi:hypothetical protein
MPKEWGIFRIRTPWLYLEISACPKYCPEIGTKSDYYKKI